MPSAEVTERILRFDAFEVDLRSREISRAGVKLKVAEQPFSVLALLLTHAGDVVTREELHKTLWPADTFVDFDRGLNKAINRLRDALGDSADAPRLIETLPKRGYRFIGIIERPAAVPDARRESLAARENEKETPPKRSRVHPAWIAIAAVILLAIGSVWWRSASVGAAPTEGGPLIRSSLLPPPGVAFVPYGIALSHDGTHLAFIAESTGGSRSLWIRAMSATNATPIAGTEDASFPFWSPDLRHVGFFADGKLKVVDVAGGAIRVIADVRRPSGGTWSSDDVIVFAPDVNGPLYRVAAAGGTSVAVTRVDEGEGIRGHRWPAFLPDGRHFLYVAFSAAAPSDNAPELRVGSLDTFDSIAVEWAGARSVSYALDHLVYVRGGTLYAQAFDVDALRTTGAPVPVGGAELAQAPAFYPSPLAVSANGVLLFQASGDLPSELIWLDAQGRERGPAPVKYAGPAISPDGRLLAGSCDGPRTGTLSICVFDLERGIGSRLTDGPSDRFPTWSRDGREIAYASASGIFRVPADGSRPPQFVSRRGSPTGWLPDGRILSFGSQNRVLSLALSSPETHAVTELWPGAEPQLSPDAAWLAYIGTEGFVVQRFPEGRPRVTIEGAGAGQPRWSRDGRRIFYIRADRKLMFADFDPATATAGAPQVLAQTRIIGAAFMGLQYDAAPDGRFIVNALTSGAAPLTLMSGWLASLQP